MEQKKFIIKSYIPESDGDHYDMFKNDKTGIRNNNLLLWLETYDETNIEKAGIHRYNYKDEYRIIFDPNGVRLLAYVKSQEGPNANIPLYFEGEDHLIDEVKLSERYISLSPTYMELNNVVYSTIQLLTSVINFINEIGTKKVNALNTNPFVHDIYVYEDIKTEEFLNSSLQQTNIAGLVKFIIENMIHHEEKEEE